MEPKKSKVIFLITLSQKNEEYIVLFYADEVFEHPPQELYFYESYGRNGNAKPIYKNESIILRQWFAIGSTEEVDQIIKELRSSRKTTLENKTFHFPEVFKKDQKAVDSFFLENNRVDKYPLPRRKIILYEYKAYPKLEELYFDSVKKDIPKNLKKSNDAQHYSVDIFPYGFLSTGDLDCYFRDNIILIDTNIFFQFDFHGERSDSFRNQVHAGKYKKLPKNFIGAVHHSPIPKHDLGVVISKNKLRAKEIEKDSIDSIDPDTSLFKYSCPEETAKGYLYFIDKQNKKILAAEKFALIQPFDSDINIRESNTAFIDFFDRKISIYPQKEPIIPRPVQEMDVFFRESYPAFNDLEYRRMLSDKIKDILKNLDNKILICDPYLLGKINIQNKKITLPDGSKVFFNAILTLLAEYELKSINFLCRRKMVPGFSDSTNIPEEYKSLKKAIDTIGNLDFRIRFSKDIFHDRYWLGKSKQSDILEISTSISGLVENNELNISSITDQSEKAKIKSRIEKLWDNSQATEVIL